MGMEGFPTLVDVSDSFCFCSGEGKGESQTKEREGVGFSLKILGGGWGPKFPPSYRKSQKNPGAHKIGAAISQGKTKGQQLKGKIVS